MARVSEEKIVLNVLKRLNEEGIPWKDSRFVINGDEVSVLGDGGFAQVVLMEDIKNPEIKYAVKILGLKADKRIHQNDYDNYKKEAILQYRLASECDTIVNILDKSIVSVKLNESGVVEEASADGSGADKFGWLAFVFIKMEKLETIIKYNLTADREFCLPKLQDLDDKITLEFAIDIAEAIYTSHKQNIMHRDVKLENVFFDSSSGKFKLGDFGIARITNNGSASTKGAGTLGYEAPEVTEESGMKNKYTIKADIYSYGATLYVLLNNLRFPGSQTYNVESRVQYNPKGIIENPERGIPELKALVCKCLQYFPENRPESMENILFELYTILNNNYGEISEQDNIISSEEKTTIVNDNLKEKENNQAEELSAIDISSEKIKNTKQDYSSVINKSESGNDNLANIPVKENDENNTSDNSSNQKHLEIGDVVAEVSLTEDDSLKESASNEENKEDKMLTSQKKTKSYKLFVGFGLMLIGLLLLELITLKNDTVNYGLFTWILCAMSVLISGISFIMKQKKDCKLPFFLYLLLTCFAIFVMIQEGNIWPIVLLAVGFLIGGVSETLVVSLGIALYPVLAFVKSTGSIDWLCNDKIIFVCLFASVLGFFWLEQYDAQDEIFSLFFSDTAFMLIWSILLIIAGLIIGLLKILSVIDGFSLLVNLHILYVGIALLIVSFIQIGKEG